MRAIFSSPASKTFKKLTIYQTQSLQQLDIITLGRKKVTNSKFIFHYAIEGNVVFSNDVASGQMKRVYLLTKTVIGVKTQIPCFSLTRSRPIPRPASIVCWFSCISFWSCKNYSSSVRISNSFFTAMFCKIRLKLAVKSSWFIANTSLPVSNSLILPHRLLDIRQTYPEQV